MALKVSNVEINEKALDLTKEQGLKHPTTEIYKRVIKELGEPDKIGKEYMKVSVKEPEIDKKVLLKLKHFFS